MRAVRAMSLRWCSGWRLLARMGSDCSRASFESIGRYSRFRESPWGGVRASGIIPELPVRLLLPVLSLFWF